MCTAANVSTGSVRRLSLVKVLDAKGLEGLP